MSCKQAESIVRGINQSGEPPSKKLLRGLFGRHQSHAADLSPFLSCVSRARWKTKTAPLQTVYIPAVCRHNEPPTISQRLRLVCANRRTTIKRIRRAATLHAKYHLSFVELPALEREWMWTNLFHDALLPRESQFTPGPSLAPPKLKTNVENTSVIRLCAHIANAA
jgi:hypothetical protein